MTGPAPIVPTADDYAQVAADLERLSMQVGSWQVPPDPGPEPGPWFGTSAPKGIDQLEGQVGVRFAAHRTYDGGFPASWDNHDAHTDTGKRYAVVSCKWKNWNDVAGAAYACETFARTWPQGQPGAFILNHEPEDNGQPGPFRTMQAACVDAWHAVCPWVPFGGNLMAYTTDPASGLHVDDWVYDGWDFLAWDGYDKETAGKMNIAKRFDPCRAVNERHALTFAIAEYGTVDTDHMPWTDDGAHYVADAGGLFCTYWNSSGTGYPYPWKTSEYPQVRELALTYGGSPLPTATVAEHAEQEPDRGVLGRRNA